MSRAGGSIDATRDADRDGGRGVFLDLDGPILDVSRRYYRVYREGCRQYGLSALDRSEYWRAKRAGLRNVELIRCQHPDADESALERFSDYWLDHIEDPEALRSDRVHPGATEAISALGERRRRFLVTLRRHRPALLEQLDRLGLRSLFRTVLSGHGSDGRDVKVELIEDAPARAAGGLVVGDSGTDLGAGRELGMVTVGVRNGIRNSELLSRHDPDFLVDSIREVPGIWRRLRRRKDSP